MIDLRSDTMTQPTAGMRAAIAAAAVGDEQKREDPTVNELERRGAELLGHEAALYLPTATMANQIALRLLGEPGDEMLAEDRKCTRLNSSHRCISYAVFCLKKKKGRWKLFECDSARKVRVMAISDGYCI